MNYSGIWYFLHIQIKDAEKYVANNVTRISKLSENSTDSFLLTTFLTVSIGNCADRFLTFGNLPSRIL